MAMWYNPNLGTEFLDVETIFGLGCEGRYLGR